MERLIAHLAEGGALLMQWTEVFVIGRTGRLAIVVERQRTALVWFHHWVACIFSDGILK